MHVDLNTDEVEIRKEMLERKNKIKLTTARKSICTKNKKKLQSETISERDEGKIYKDNTTNFYHRGTSTLGREGW